MLAKTDLRDCIEEMDAAAKEELVDRVLEKLFAENRMFRPMYPWVFVYTCKREQKVGHIVLPDHVQNKVVHEGIVMATWRPFTEEHGTVDEKGRKLTRTVQRRSLLERGQHVLFPHWAGQPISGYNPERYRVVKECDWKVDKDGGILGILDYDDKETMPSVVLRELLGDMIRAEIDEKDWTVTDHFLGLLAAQVNEKFFLVDREIPSVTLSGK
jgi:co-chaperonin GroES (HSP10)